MTQRSASGRFLQCCKCRNFVPCIRNGSSNVILKNKTCRHMLCWNCVVEELLQMRPYRADSFKCPLCSTEIVRDHMTVASWVRLHSRYRYWKWHTFAWYLCGNTVSCRAIPKKYYYWWAPMNRRVWNELFGIKLRRVRRWLEPLETSQSTMEACLLACAGSW